MSVTIAALPVEVEADAMARACLSGSPVYVPWTGDAFELTDEAPDVACWVFMPPPMVQAA